MSLKNLDSQGRWRNKTVAFRVSPEEDAQIEKYVALSGLTKQEYITNRLLCRDLVVQGNPRVYKALRNQLKDVRDQLRLLNEKGENPGQDLMDLIDMITVILGDMSHEK